MFGKYPDNEDGRLLQKLEDHGQKMDEPMKMYFSVATKEPDEGRAIADVVSEKGFEIDFHFDSENDEWVCTCLKDMLAEYDAIAENRKYFTALAEESGGYFVTWGTFGNV